MVILAFYLRVLLTVIYSTRFINKALVRPPGSTTLSNLTDLERATLIAPWGLLPPAIFMGHFLFKQKIVVLVIPLASSFRKIFLLRSLILSFFVSLLIRKIEGQLTPYYPS